MASPKPDEVGVLQGATDLADHGEIIAAIKLVREHSGVGLKEAKDAVEAYLANPTRKQTPATNLDPAQIDIPRAAIRALENGQLIEAVRQLRQSSGGGLKESKEILEAFLQQHPNTDAKFRTCRKQALKQRLGTCVLFAVALGLIAFAYLHVF